LLEPQTEQIARPRLHVACALAFAFRLLCDTLVCRYDRATKWDGPMFSQENNDVVMPTYTHNGRKGWAGEAKRKKEAALDDAEQNRTHLQYARSLVITLTFFDDRPLCDAVTCRYDRTTRTTLSSGKTMML